MYGSIGYTRRDSSRPRILTKQEKHEVEKLETEKEKLFRNIENTYLENEDEEKKVLAGLYEKLETLTEKISVIKYEKIKR